MGHYQHSKELVSLQLMFDYHSSEFVTIHDNHAYHSLSQLLDLS
jgi:hypothetical protein